MVSGFKKQRIQSSACKFWIALNIFLASAFSLKAEFPFKDYEKITYTIKWLFISCGKASLEIKKIGPYRYQITSLAWSLPFFDNFYRVRDRVISIWDTKAMRSLLYEKYIEEGKFRDHEIIEVDPETDTAIFDKKDKWKVSKNALDVLSALYYVRTKNLKGSEKIEFDTYTKRKLWKMKVIFHGKKTIKINGKIYKTIVVEPILREEGIFKAKGKIFVYLTDDEKKIPVLMVSKIPIGSIRAVMDNIEKNHIKTD